MNKHDAKEFLPLVQALADGKTIQGRVSIGGEWVDFEDNEDIVFDDPRFYQVKPEPFECWVIVNEATHTIEGAYSVPQCGATDCRTIHMREVTE